MGTLTRIEVWAMEVPRLSVRVESSVSGEGTLCMQPMNFHGVSGDDMPMGNRQRKHRTARGLPRRRGLERTAMASRMSRTAAKSGCACEGGGWGQISEDGRGQHNRDRTKGPWGRAAAAARTEVLESATIPDTERGTLDRGRRHEGRWQTGVLGRPCLMFRP